MFLQKLAFFLDILQPIFCRPLFAEVRCGFRAFHARGFQDLSGPGAAGRTRQGFLSFLIDYFQTYQK